MRWLLSAYSIRLNHRHKLLGHVFSGRYKAVLVDGSGTGYLKAACDYVHLNPARAGLLKRKERLLGYPWSSLGWYLAAHAHRPAWIEVRPLLGEHGIRRDTSAGRLEFERRMEARRAEGDDEEAWKAIRRGWCLGSAEFKREMLELVEGNLAEDHAGGLRQQSAEAKAERIMAEELRRLRMTREDLALRRKNDPDKLAMAARLKRETTLTLKAITAFVGLGSSKSANTKLHQWMKNNPAAPAKPRSVSSLRKASAQMN